MEYPQRKPLTREEYRVGMKVTSLENPSMCVTVTKIDEQGVYTKKPDEDLPGYAQGAEYTAGPYSWNMIDRGELPFVEIEERE